MKASVKPPGNCKPPYSGGPSRKGTKMRKRVAGNKTIEENITKSDKTSESDAIGNGVRRIATEGVNRSAEEARETSTPNGTDNPSYDEKTKSDWEGSTNEKKGDDNIKDGGIDRSCDRANAMSPIRKCGSEYSNVSSPMSECKSVNNVDDFLENIESPGTARGIHVISASEGTSDISNEACDEPGLPNAGLTTDNGYEYSELDKGRDLTGKDNEEVVEENKSCIGRKREREREERKNYLPEIISGCSEENLPKEKQEETEGESEEKAHKVIGKKFERISANNLELDKDGKSVIVWTRYVLIAVSP